MKYLFCKNFVHLLLNTGYKKVNNIFYKNFNGILYFVFPIIDAKNKEFTQKINSEFKYILQNNFNKFNLNKIVFLKIFILDEFEENFFINIDDEFDINSQILSLQWAIDISKNKVFVRKGHIKNILNIQEIIKKAFLNETIENKIYIKYNNKIFVSFTLILINFIIYFYVNLFNKSNFYNIIQNFAISPNIINNLQFYRLFTAMFLHADFFHLISNCLSLYIFGIITENLIGKYLFIICYFLGGIFAGILSSIFNQGLSIGASGAIFAIEGALVYFYLKEKDNFVNLNLYQFIIIIIISIFMGLIIPNVDNIGHITGFLTGFFIMLVVYNLKKYYLKNK